jgi:hypothetical protein
MNADYLDKKIDLLFFFTFCIESEKGAHIGSNQEESPPAQKE